MKSKLAIWSFITLILMLIIAFSPLSVIFYYEGILWIVAPILELIPLILGISALVAINKNKGLTGKWFAIISVVVSGIFLIVGIGSYFVS